jgi:hypothetical protein
MDIAPFCVWSSCAALFIVKARSTFDLPGRISEHFGTNTAMTSAWARGAIEYGSTVSQDFFSATFRTASRQVGRPQQRATAPLPRPATAGARHGATVPGRRVTFLGRSELLP